MKIGDIEVDLKTPVVMTIVNVTPDSFFGGSRTVDRTAVERRIVEAVSEGCAMIDIGGYSTRPGAAPVDSEEEFRRVSLGVEAARAIAPNLPLSIDTFRASVVRRILDRFGPCIVNDISSGMLDPEMIATVASYGVPYIAMHSKGDPQTMQQLTEYEDLRREIETFFVERIAALDRAGVKEVVLDPGFGFAKTTEQNYRLLGCLESFRALGRPLLAGLSRKSMIYRPLGISPDEALNGTTALHWECLRQGVSILRVHDTRAAVETVRLYECYKQALA